VTDELERRRRERERETRPVQFKAMDPDIVAARKAWWRDPHRTGHYPGCPCAPCTTRVTDGSTNGETTS
jgi:hypothetical protein